MREIKVLMVCMGNICRSPLAHGHFEALVREAGLADRIRVDSAGTHAYHIGKSPDPRSQDTARRHGLDLGAQRARQVNADDFDAFDYIIAMDRDNLAILDRFVKDDSRARLQLFLEYAPELAEEEVPDPYYGGPDGFEHVYSLVDAASRGLFAAIRREHFS